MTEQEIFQTQKETNEHIKTVRKFMLKMVDDVIERAFNHDQVKNESPEIETFIEFTPKLKDSTYGSNEYKEFLKGMKPALDHHYKNSKHHPEHYKNGINGMNLVDLLEMMCDWKAATLRHSNGNISKSIEINSKRFDIDNQLKDILNNTVKEYFEEKNETIEEGFINM